MPTDLRRDRAQFGRCDVPRKLAPHSSQDRNSVRWATQRSASYPDSGAKCGKDSVNCCSPCSLSLTHQPSAASHSPAVTEGNDPTTVVSSRCPCVVRGSTQKPFSSLWKVTRSMTPEISSVASPRSGIAAFMRGSHFLMDGFGFVEVSGVERWYCSGCHRHQSGDHNPG